MRSSKSPQPEANPSNRTGEERLGRRSMLGLATRIAMGASASTLFAGESVEGESRDAAIDLETFVREVVPLVKDLLPDTSRIGQERYLHMLAAFAARLRDVPLPEMRETSKNASARTFLGAHECEAPFSILHWRLEPGAKIGLHPHIYGNVVTLCLGGEVRIENYEMVEARDFDRREPFPVRRTNDQFLLAGDLNLVSLEHGYVHGFVGGASGAHGLDITTRIREKRSTPTLVVSSEPIDLERRIFEGRWQTGS